MANPRVTGCAEMLAATDELVDAFGVLGITTGLTSPHWYVDHSYRLPTLRLTAKEFRDTVLSGR